jgi:hypothetical protein
VRVLALQEVMRAKIEAFLSRREVRDVFDIEFLIKKGVEIKASYEEIMRILDLISQLKKKDYSIKLGTILDAEQRKYYISENFKILIMKLKDILEGYG